MSITPCFSVDKRTHLVHCVIVGILQEASRLVLGKHRERRVDGDVEPFADLGELVPLAGEGLAVTFRPEFIT